jgi:ankyrin repeat protein
METGAADPVEQFKSAVEAADTDRVRALIGLHPSLVSQLDEPLFCFDAPAIVIAAGKRDRKLIDVLLDAGADVNARSRWWAGGFGVLPNGDPAVAAHLISRGATVDAYAAAGMGMLDRLQELVDADPEQVRMRGGDGQTPLHVAATPEIAAFLLDRGAEIDARDVDHGSTAAQYALADRPDVCRTLIRRGAEPDLFMACSLNDVELAKTLLRADPRCLQARVGQGKFTSGDSEGGHIYLYTLGYAARPLHVAAEHGGPELMELLLEHSSPSGRLLLACVQADEATVREILARHPGAIGSLPPEDMRLISDAAWENKLDAVRVMLDAGFHVDARGIHDSTPLDRAAIRGFVEMVRLLLRHNASLDVRNEFGGTPLSACIWGSVHFRDPRGDYPAAVESLLAAGAPVPKEAGGSEAVADVLRRYGAAARLGPE